MVTNTQAPIRAEDERGFTLIESLFAGVILSVILGVAITMFISMTQVLQTTSSKSDSTVDAKLASEHITRYVQTAVAPTFGEPALIRASQDSLRFYSNIDTVNDPAPAIVEYRYSGGKKCLEQTITRAREGVNGPQWNSGDAQTTCIAPVVEPPRFTYYATPALFDAAGEAETVTLPAGGAVVGANDDTLKSVRSVGLALSVGERQGGSNGPEPTDLDLRITLTNLNLAGSA